MDRSDIITLVKKESHSQNPDASWNERTGSTGVYAAVLSVTRSEWFEAGAEGIVPEYVFVIDRNEYEGEKIVLYNGQKYGVFRTYAGKGEELELHCERKGGLRA